MKKRLFLFLCLVMTANCMFSASTLDSLLTICTKEMDQSAVYCERHSRYIDSLKRVRPMTCEMQVRIAREYQYFQSDSARVWYLRLVDADEPYRTKAYTGLVELSTSIGKYWDAQALINKVDDSMPDSLRVNWIEAIWRLYTETAAQSDIPAFRQFVLDEAKVYYDSLLRVMEHQAQFSTDIRLRYNILKAQDADDILLAMRINDTILSRVPVWSHPYAIEAYNRSTMYERLGQDCKRIEWLTRSAIADVLCGITDNGSSWLVAKELYESGDLERAYIFSDYSLTNASFFNAPTRFIQTYTMGHEIASSYERQLHSYSVRLIIVLIALGVALIIMVFGIMFAWRQNRRLSNVNSQLSIVNSQLSTLNSQLKESDHVKEQYICRYLEVYSDYIRRLTTMARRAGEKDATAFMNREMDSFYRSFDDTFLSLYGTFVQDFNALLRPEMRITPKPGERMTVEMRIFALILLGIDNSAKIAELLCYSPNTISNYRVKIKNAALGNRDAFEKQIRQIGTLKH